MLGPGFLDCIRRDFVTEYLRGIYSFCLGCLSARGVVLAKSCTNSPGFVAKLWLPGQLRELSERMRCCTC